MQALGDSTLAAFMKSDVFLTGESSKSDKKPLVEGTNVSTGDTCSRRERQSERTQSARKAPRQKYWNDEGKENAEPQRPAVPIINIVTELSDLHQNSRVSARSLHSSIASPLLLSSQDRLRLASWGLPLAILRKYEARGVLTMFPWQVECLSNAAVLDRARNLVYSAPTSAGKTLVSEILVIKTVVERRKKAIFILPFVSVVREKMYYFQDLLADSGVRVEGFMGGVHPPGGFAATDLAIATIEKANSLVNQMMEEGGLENLGAVVIDELHLLGDPFRGYLLELLLTKLRYMTLKLEIRIQLIGMSATLPNLDLLARWLDADLFKTDFRPVPLRELCKIGPTVYDDQLTPVRTVNPRVELPADPDGVLQLCLETIADGHSILIFCPTKSWCETLAQQISSAFAQLGRTETSAGVSLRDQLNTEAIVETLEQLKRSPAGLDAVLKATVSFAVAFHHAGLTMDERDVIEGAFRCGALRVLTATSTLSSGVNLPARRVMIRTIMFHGKPIDTLTYKQMIGRAGRMGKDTAGESILLCKPSERTAVKNLLQSDLQPVESCLQGSGPLIRALLEAVASEVAYTQRDIELYTKCTLLSFTSDETEVKEATDGAVDFLVKNELLLLQKSEAGVQRWVATQLGKACLAASVQPRDGLFLFQELQRARKCFVLDTELHVLYLVTPFSSSNLIGKIDWYIFLDLWKGISESERRVGQLVGVSENYLMTAVSSAPRPGRILDVHKRFFTALALYDLVREVPLSAVCRKYSCCRGVIQSLQQTASTFAGMVTQFCRRLGWSCMELLVSQFQARLQFGVCRELLDLLRLPTLNGLRARSLYKEGITTVAELAAADEMDVERALYKALPFESEREQVGENEGEVDRRKKMRTVFVTGRDGLTPREAAVLLVREARVLVQNELGLDDVHWDRRDRSKRRNETCTSMETSNATSVVLKVHSGLSNFSSTSGSLVSCPPSIRGDLLSRSASLSVAREEEEVQITENIRANAEEKAAAPSPIVIPSIETTKEVKKTADTPRQNSTSKASVTRSPDLFADSLNLDTQECNLLERNVIDLDDAVFDESNSSEFHALERKEKSAEAFAKPRSTSAADENRSKSLVWDEDSWSNPNVVLDAVKKLRTPPAASKPIWKENSDVEKLRQVSKRKFSSPRSPIVAIVTYDSPRVSTGSKSEDDVVPASQIADCISTKSRTRIKLESIRVKTQKAVKTPKAAFVCNECADSVVVNSDDEAPPKRNKTKTQVKEKQRRLDFKELQIVNVAERSKFAEFKRELSSRTEVSLALACETYLKDTVSIGTRIVGATYQEVGKKSRKVEQCVYNDKKLCGVAVSWGCVVYFVSFENGQDGRVSVRERMSLLTELLTSQTTVRCFASKEVYRTLFRCCNITATCQFLDPIVADWLLDPDGLEKTFSQLIGEHLPEATGLLQRLGALPGHVGPGLNTRSSASSDVRAATEALLTFWLQRALTRKLEKVSLLATFRDVEMRTVALLARMELTGLGVNLAALQELAAVIQQQLSFLEAKAYDLAGRKFNFSSSKSVAQVLGMDTTRKVSTSKAVLEQSDHPVARLVVSWRKLNSTHSKMVCPLLSLAERSSRIHGTCVTHSVTGRVSMHEPNLQNVPRDFDAADGSFVISVRMAFVPMLGNVILSADYCQLELRILAHFSEESTLCGVLRQPGDVFRNIAARWYNEAEERVDDAMRQRTKQLCYGMIYGMGVKSLAEALQVNEAEAREFMETFMAAYPGIRRWLTEVVEEARSAGFVTTLLGRRRFLPGLNSESAGERGQAERQAVNTKVQGSAADIAKKAMVLVDERVQSEFPDVPLVLPDVSVRRRLRSSRDLAPRGAHLVLQLHDELLYEVNAQDLDTVVGIVRECMERAHTLDVPLPVRIKVGPAWGDLEEYKWA